MTNPCTPTCGTGSIAVISVPLSMIPSAGAAGAGAAATTAPNVAYVPAPGSLLAGMTNVGTATDKIADLLKLLGNPNFTSAVDSNVVYNATTKQFEPSPILPILTQLKNGAPGTANGDSFKWDAASASWAIGQPSQIAGSIANFSGFNTAGTAVTQAVGPTLAAAITAAPNTTTASPPTSIAALNATGSLVEAAVVQLPTKTLVPYVGVTATSPAAGNTTFLINSGTIAADGTYQYQGAVAFLLKSTGLPLQSSTPIGFFRVTIGGVIVYYQSVLFPLASSRATTAGESIGQFNAVFASQQFKSTAGATVLMEFVTPNGISTTFEPFNVDALFGTNGIQRVPGNYIV